MRKQSTTDQVFPKIRADQVITAIRSGEKTFVAKTIEGDLRIDLSAMGRDPDTLSLQGSRINGNVSILGGMIGSLCLDDVVIYGKLEITSCCREMFNKGLRVRDGSLITTPVNTKRLAGQMAASAAAA